MNSLTRTRSEYFHSLTDNDGCLITDVRKSDGYIDATKLCKNSGKDWSEYYRMEATKKFLKALEASPDVVSNSRFLPKNSDFISRDKVALVQNSPGKNGTCHTFVHPQVAINLATWISPMIAVKVTETIITSGQITKRPFDEIGKCNESEQPPSYDQESVKSQMMMMNEYVDERVVKPPSCYMRFLKI